MASHQILELSVLSFAQQVKGLMIASIQALIPVIAGLVPAIMAVLMPLVY